MWIWLERLDPKAARVPRPDVVAVRVANLQEKDLMVTMQPDRYLTEPHYNGYPAVLVRLPVVDTGELEILITDAWKCQAPKALVKAMESAPGTMRFAASPVCTSRARTLSLVNPQPP